MGGHLNAYTSREQVGRADPGQHVVNWWMPHASARLHRHSSAGGCWGWAGRARQHSRRLLVGTSRELVAEQPASMVLGRYKEPSLSILRPTDPPNTHTHTHARTFRARPADVLLRQGV